MQIELIFKVSAVGLTVAILNQLLVKAGKDEYAVMTTLTGMVIVITLIIKEISMLFNTIKSTFGF